MQQKECINCNIMRRIDKFTPLKYSHGGLSHVRDTMCDHCKIKLKIPNIITTLNPLEGKLYIFNISEEDYNRLFGDQEGCCKICKTHQSKLKRKLCIDHCHITNEVRGLLCNTCNTGIGLLRDSIENLENAILYLKKNKSQGQKFDQKAIREDTTK